ncbi:protein CUSTOS isoform X1 [Macrotis lagotis]|uniref:protein CUSTOS isoform X1 n=1 Tax=Macrotis lagotis TaxID=92651 RepID=UPI003D68BBBC
MHGGGQDGRAQGQRERQRQQRGRRRRLAAAVPGGGRAGLGLGAAATGGAGGHGRFSSRPTEPQRADGHEQDGNELRTTPEFRGHVAKKLGALLDSCITILESSPRPSQAPMQTDPGEDDGFRLFFTSIPGSPKDSGPPTGSRKRPPSRSSESDSDEEWRRCQEAAVSGTDIIRHGALPAQEAPEEKQVPKKKKKKKKKHLEVGQDEEAGPKVTTEKPPQPLSLHRHPEGGEAQHNGGHAPLNTKKKKRKKNQKEEIKAPSCTVQKGKATSAAE